MPDGLTFAAEAAHREFEADSADLGSAHLDDRVNQVFRAFVADSQSVIWHKVLTLVIRLVERTFFLHNLILVELLFIVNSRLTVHALGVNVIRKSVSPLHKYGCRGCRLHDIGNNLRLVGVK